MCTDETPTPKTPEESKCRHENGSTPKTTQEWNSETSAARLSKQSKQTNNTKNEMQ